MAGVFERVVFVMPVPIPWEDLAARTQEFRSDRWNIRQTDKGGVRLENRASQQAFDVEGVGYSLWLVSVRERLDRLAGVPDPAPPTMAEAVAKMPASPLDAQRKYETALAAHGAKKKR